MKKIINGKKYDTETAKEVGRWYNDQNYNDFNSFSEKLYRKRTGEFFLFGEGNANTKYAENIGNNSWGSGEEIIPLSFEKAMSWAEKNLSSEEYEESFGEIKEDESKRVVGISLTVAAHEKIKRMASETGISISELLENFITEK